MHRLLVTANVVPSSLIHVTLMMEAILSCNTPVLTRATRHHIPEVGILHSERRENLKSHERSQSQWAIMQPKFQTFTYNFKSEDLPFNEPCSGLWIELHRLRN
jgi:hypothetical protein